MRIIYLEDDLIDQRLFKRACRDIKNLEVTYYVSCLGLKEDYINSYDGIVIDQFLQDCSIKQFADKHITIPMAVLSASEKLVSEHPANLGIWQKPIKEDTLRDILLKMQPSKNESISTLSLEYITDLTQGDEAETQDLLQSIYKSIEENNHELENAADLSAQDLQQYLHKQKSKIGIFYLEKLHRQIDQAENKLKDGATVESILTLVSDIVKQTSNMLIDLKTHLK